MTATVYSPTVGKEGEVARLDRKKALAIIDEVLESGPRFGVSCGELVLAIAASLSDDRELLDMADLAARVRLFSQVPDLTDLGEQEKKVALDEEEMRAAWRDILVDELYGRNARATKLLKPWVPVVTELLLQLRKSEVIVLSPAKTNGKSAMLATRGPQYFHMIRDLTG